MSLKYIKSGWGKSSLYNLNLLEKCCGCAWMASCLTVPENGKSCLRYIPRGYVPIIHNTEEKANDFK